MSCEHEVRKGSVTTIISNPNGPEGCSLCELDQLKMENEKLRSALDEIAMNAKNLRNGGLAHFSREEFADTVAFRANHALLTAGKKSCL